MDLIVDPAMHIYYIYIYVLPIHFGGKGSRSEKGDDLNYTLASDKIGHYSITTILYKAHSFNFLNVKSS